MQYNYRPERTLQFHAYAAEVVSLLLLLPGVSLR